MEPKGLFNENVIINGVAFKVSMKEELGGTSLRLDNKVYKNTIIKIRIEEKDSKSYPSADGYVAIYMDMQYDPANDVLWCDKSNIPDAIKVWKWGVETPIVGSQDYVNCIPTLKSKCISCMKKSLIHIVDAVFRGNVDADKDLIDRFTPVFNIVEDELNEKGNKWNQMH